MGTAWGLVAIGLILVALASKPVQRARANAAERLQERKNSQERSSDLKTPLGAITAPTDSSVASGPAAGASESLTPQWLDSLIGSDSAVVAEDPFDDAEGIAVILRLWLAEDSQ